MNNELKRIWKEKVMVSEWISYHFLRREWGKQRRTKIREPVFWPRFEPSTCSVQVYSVTASLTCLLPCSVFRRRMHFNNIGGASRSDLQSSFFTWILASKIVRPSYKLLPSYPITLQQSHYSSWIAGFMNRIFLSLPLSTLRSEIVVKALCYKPEGRRFQSRSGECEDFQFT
jgi:hypothetical protein